MHHAQIVFNVQARNMPTKKRDFMVNFMRLASLSG